MNVKYLDVKAFPRFWEDAFINEVTEDNDSPTIFGYDKDDNSWNIRIDVETGIILDWPESACANIHYKVCDEGTYTLLDEKLNILSMGDSYVPDCLSPQSDGFGDYIILKITNKGEILGWKFNDSDITDILNRYF